jgi:hypothetical protein
MGHVPFSMRPARSRLSILVLSAVATLALVGSASATPDGKTTPSSISLAAVAGSACTFQSQARSACITFTGFFGESPTGGTLVPTPFPFCNPTTNVNHAINCEELELVNNLAAGTTRTYTVEIRYNPDTSIQDLGVWADGMLIAEGLGDSSCVVPGTDPPQFELGCARVEFQVTGGSGNLIVTVSPFFFACPPGLPDPTNPLATCPNEPFEGIVTTEPEPGPGTGGGDDGGVVPPDPPVSINDVRLVEGDALTTSATFTVTMGWTSEVPVTVNYVTADNDPASATAGTDYLPTTGTVVFLPGELVHRITVPVLGETLREGRETFHVYLVLPEPVRVGTIGDGDGVGTIANDDWGRRMSGSGSVLGTAKNSFSLRLFEFGSWWNTIRYYQGSGFSFRSKQIQSLSFDELSRSVRVTGTGWNAGKSVTFTLEAVDNGDPGTLDLFVLVLSDGSRADGPLASGNLKYTG